MSTEKLIHDIPFVIEAGRRQTFPVESPAATTEKTLIVDELTAAMIECVKQRVAVPSSNAS